MDLQLSNPITSPSGSARSAVAPATETQSGQLQDGVAADAVSVNFAKLLAQALPRGNGRTISTALKVPGTDAKDQKIADKTDLSSQAASILSANVIADDQKTPHSNPHSSRNTTEPGIEVAGPIIASFMLVQQAAGAKTASGTESILLPASSAITRKSVSSNASITDTAVQQGANEAQAQEARPGFAVQTEHSSTMEATALPEKQAIQPTGFNAMPTDRIASMPSPTLPLEQATPVQHLALPAPLGSYDWDSQLGQRVVWMSSQQNHVADIRINPPELGPIELRLTLDNQQSVQNATLHFASPHAEVREAIENSMPRLRELMADAGITLGNATVSGESFPRQQTSGQGSTAARNPATLSSGESGAIEATPPSASRGSTLLDTFA